MLNELIDNRRKIKPYGSGYVGHGSFNEEVDYLVLEAPRLDGRWAHKRVYILSYPNFLIIHDIISPPGIERLTVLDQFFQTKNLPDRRSVENDKSFILKDEAYEVFIDSTAHEAKVFEGVIDADRHFGWNSPDNLEFVSEPTLRFRSEDQAFITTMVSFDKKYELVKSRTNQSIITVLVAGQEMVMNFDGSKVF